MTTTNSNLIPEENSLLTHTPRFSVLDPDKLPPNNTEAEENVLGGILQDPDALDRVIGFLHPEAFYHQAHQKLYRCFLAMHKKGEPTDPISVSNYLQDRKQLDSIGGRSKLAYLVDRTVSTVNIDLYAKLLSEKWLKRAIISFGNECVHSGYESLGDAADLFSWLQKQVETLQNFFQVPNGEDADTAKYNRCISEVREIELSVTDPGLKSWKLKKLADKYGCSSKQLEEIYYRSLLSADNEPPLTWDELKAAYGESTREWLAHGLMPKGSVILMHADGGVGKTRLAYDLLYHVATGEDWGDFLFQKQRCLVVQTDEPANDMLQALEDRGLANNPLVRYKSRWTIEFIQALKNDIEQFKPRLVIIDSLSTINKHSCFSENDVEYARPILLLRDIAQEYDITIILVHHSSRKGNARGSTAIRNSVSEVWKLKPDPSLSADGTHRVLEIEKSRSRTKANYSLRYDEDTCSYTFLGKVGEADTLPDDAKARIIEFLRQRPGTFFAVEEIHEAVGNSFDHIRRCCANLAYDRIIARKGKRPTLYGLNFGDAPVTDDTTDHQKNTGSNDDQFDDQKPETMQADNSSPFRSSDHQKTTFSTQPLIAKSENQMIKRMPESPEPLPAEGYRTDHVSDRASDRVPIVRAGDRIVSLADDRQGTVEGVQQQRRGSPKKPFTTRHAVVNWDDGIQSCELIETLRHATADDLIQKGEPDASAAPPGTADQTTDISDCSEQPRSDSKTNLAADGSEPADSGKASICAGVGGESSQEQGEVVPRTKTKWKVGDRIITEHGHTATIHSVEKFGYQVIYDNARAATPVPLEKAFVRFEHLPPEQDPKVKAKELFDQIKPGDKLKAKKHHDHKGFARRVGTVLNKKIEDNKPLACCETDKGFEIFNLEAVEIVSD